jgi:hypothetical protein
LSSIWHSIYAFPPTTQAYYEKGFKDFAKRWLPILDASTDSYIVPFVEDGGGRVLIGSQSRGANFGVLAGGGSATFSAGAADGIKPVKIVGIVQYGDGTTSLGGSTTVLAPLIDVQNWWSLQGKASYIYAKAK